MFFHFCLFCVVDSISGDTSRTCKHCQVFACWPPPEGGDGPEDTYILKRDPQNGMGENGPRPAGRPGGRPRARARGADFGAPESGVHLGGLFWTPKIGQKKAFIYFPFKNPGGVPGGYFGGDFGGDFGGPRGPTKK